MGSLVESILISLSRMNKDGGVLTSRTKVQTGRALEYYRRQVSLNAAPIARATGRDSTGVLIHL